MVLLVPQPLLEALLLLGEVDELNLRPKPIKWTDTKAKLLIKFGAPSPNQLAA